MEVARPDADFNKRGRFNVPFCRKPDRFGRQVRLPETQGGSQQEERGGNRHEPSMHQIRWNDLLNGDL